MFALFVCDFFGFFVSKFPKNPKQMGHFLLTKGCMIKKRIHFHHMKKLPPGFQLKQKSTVKGENALK